MRVVKITEKTILIKKSKHIAVRQLDLMPLKFVFKDVSDTEKWCPTEGSRRRSPGKIHAWCIKLEVDKQLDI